MGKYISFKEVPYGYKEASRVPHPSMCPAAFILGRRNTMSRCKDCPLNREDVESNRVRRCHGKWFSDGLGYDLLDHPFHLVGKESNDKVFLAYPYHIYGDEMGLIHEYCKFHGLTAEISNVYSMHGSFNQEKDDATAAVGLWFRKKKE